MASVDMRGGGRARPTVRATPGKTVVHVLDGDVERNSVTSSALIFRGFAPMVRPDVATLRAAVLGQGHVVLADDAAVDDLGGLTRWLGEVPLLLLSSRFDVPSVVAAMRAGAYDVIPKPADMDVVAAAANRASVRHVTARRRNEVVSRDANVDPSAPLTPREKDVLRCLVLGLTNKRTGTLLGISDRTVEVHRARIISKTKAGTIASLARRIPTGVDPEVNDAEDLTRPAP